MPINDFAPQMLTAPWIGAGGQELGGSYIAQIPGGAYTTIAAGAPLVSAHWTDTTKSMILTSLGVKMSTQVAFTTAQYVQLLGYISRNNSGPATAGTNLFTSTVERVKTGMPASRLINVQVANAGSTPLSAPTQQTLSNPILNLDYYASALGIESASNNPYDLFAGQGRTIILNAGEGIEILNGILMGAVGTVSLVVSMTWLELPKALADSIFGL